MKVLITGADGFIGRNLCQRILEKPAVEIRRFGRSQDVSQLPGLIDGVSFVFHLAGVKRPSHPGECQIGNADLTRRLCADVGAATVRLGRAIPVAVASSTQAAGTSSYGISKRSAEDEALKASTLHGFPLHLFRLPNIFGKWARPNYNSVVATFCHNVARGLPIEVHDASARMSLAYVDDVVDQFIAVMEGQSPPRDSAGFATVAPQFDVTVGELADQIRHIHAERQSQSVGLTGCGFHRALYATYVSYLPVEQSLRPLPLHQDRRGRFAEVIKTPGSGQVSYFTAHPGVTRGGHYHHSKVERFLVVAGQARFRFRNLLTGERFEKTVMASEPHLVETLPGWAHDVTNVGDQELIVLLWANENFDPERADTYASPLWEE
jgi:UDP-2-acetamido-2,6-beta-L-arabino-hexul-4-ose reductase